MRFFQKFLLLTIFLSSAGYGNCAPNPPKTTECGEQAYHQTRRGDWFTRLRALYVLPNDSSGSVNTIPHSKVGVHPAWTGEFDVGFMFTDNLGLELILATTRHTLVGEGSLAGTKIGTTWLLPPTLTAQWRPFSNSWAQPYVGAGVNYTLFYGNNCSLPSTNMSLSHSWGPAVQGGLDLFFYEDWLFNLDIKYIWIGTEATLSGGVSGRVCVDINPWVFGFGFGRKW